MSKNRKNLKSVSICMMTVGVVVPVVQIILCVTAGQPLLSTYVLELVVLGVIGVATGYLGSMAANVPSKTPAFLKASYLLIVAGVAVSICCMLTNPTVDGMVGLVFAVLAFLGVMYGRKVLERAQR